MQLSCLLNAGTVPVYIFIRLQVSVCIHLCVSISMYIRPQVHTHTHSARPCPQGTGTGICYKHHTCTQAHQATDKPILFSAGLGSLLPSWTTVVGLAFRFTALDCGFSPSVPRTHCRSLPKILICGSFDLLPESARTFSAP